MKTITIIEESVPWGDKEWEKVWEIIGKKIIERGRRAYENVDMERAWPIPAPFKPKT